MNIFFLRESCSFFGNSALTFESVSGIIVCADLSEKLLKNDSNWKEPGEAIVV